MKNLFFISAIVLGSVSLAHTQDFSIGPTAGINYAWISNAPSDARGLLGLNVGVTMVYSFNEQWGLGMDLKYSGEGMAIEQGGLVAKTKLDYIRVPLKLYGFFNQLGDDFRPKVYIGPSFGFLIGGETEQFIGQTIRTVASKDWFEPFDLGVIVGTGFNYRLSQSTWLNFDVAYTHGLLDIVTVGEGSNRNMNVNLGIAWGL